MSLFKRRLLGLLNSHFSHYIDQKCYLYTCPKNFRSDANRLSHGFYEDDPKSGYGLTQGDVPVNLETIKVASQVVSKEFQKFKEEIKEHLAGDRCSYDIRHGEIWKFWNFNEDTVRQWSCTADSDHGEGFSKANFAINEQGNAEFSGVLSTEVPKDGRVFRAGYCNIRSPDATKSFNRESTYDWTEFTHIVLKVRGDGRPYMLNIGVKGTFDITWADVFSYCLFTRGGPYWQLSKIPFSKFFFSSKGRIQDKQAPVPQGRVTSFGITLADQVEGPFNLEIEYIGLMLDESHNEETAYETYQMSDGWIALV